jgi:hypothetical protein
MEIDHFIPAARLTKPYLKSLIHGYGLCTCELLAIETPWWQQPLLLTKSFLGSLRRIGCHYATYGYRSRQSLQAECELSFHTGNLKSAILYLPRRMMRWLT